jgi:hypothetical protein
VQSTPDQTVTRTLPRIGNPLSRCAIRIELHREDELGTVAGGFATGFLWQHQGQHFLVTNIHNLTGRNPVTNESVALRTGMIPTHVEASIAWGHAIPGGMRQKQAWRRVGLRRPDGSAKWLVHPVHGSAVDVAVVPLGWLEAPSFLAGDVTDSLSMMTHPVNTGDHWTDMQVNAGDDAFVLGFPLGMSSGHGLPIWKRASIASEPDLDYENLPRLLVDAYTRQGMSGSPVIAVQRGIVRLNGPQGTENHIGSGTRFIGVYSGRIADDPMGASLGFVWKSSVIPEIVEGQVYGEGWWD